jgi:hypothetical protein
VHGGTTRAGLVPGRNIFWRIAKPNDNAQLRSAGGCHDILSGHQRFRIQYSRVVKIPI